jgi:hypothetical protein
VFRAFKSFALAAAALLTLGAAVSLAAHVPGGALRSAKHSTVAPPSASAPTKFCRAQRTAMGAAAFSQVWTGHTGAAAGAMRACVKYMKSANSNGTATTTQHRIMNAVTTCKADRRRNLASFASTFGTNTNAKNALGRCVKSRSKLNTGRVGR